MQDLSKVINSLYEKYKNDKKGKRASYIPELSKVDSKKFGIAITTVTGETYCAGDADFLFSMQSISKPFVFGLALESHGLKKVRQKVDVEPTGEPFNSIIRLDTKSKRPLNPLVNTGAIAMTDLIEGKSKKERQKILNSSFEKYIGKKVEIDKSVFTSEKITGHRNRAIAHLMLNFDMVKNSIDDTLDLYFEQCAYKVNAVDLSVMAATLANSGINPVTQIKAVDEKYIKHILAIMFTCGLYTYAGEWAFDVGLPAKSGVSGGILAVVPGVMGIGVFSPLIDVHGNSVKGVKVCEDLSKKLKLHSFQA